MFKIEGTVNVFHCWGIEMENLVPVLARLALVWYSILSPYLPSAELPTTAILLRKMLALA